ncbi:MAG: TonB-dependent receptor [Bacteroidota bacterium]
MKSTLTYKLPRNLLLGALLLFSSISMGWSQQIKFTISGYIKDAKSGETLIGASLYIKELGTGAVTNAYGFYSLSLPQGSYQLNFSYIGYEEVQKTIELADNLTLNIELAEQEESLDEILILGESENANVSNIQMSINKLDIKTIQKMPALLGEVDIIKSIQLLPGVSTVGEGATGFNVRGGGVDQNLVLLDEAPVYNSSHLFGFFSVFNPDAVKDVKLIKGGIPSQYGGRLSSILDVRMKEGNNKRFAANGGIGAIFSRLTLEAPIIKDKASFILAGRRSYLDVLARPFLDEDLRNSAFNFYDLTLKTNFNLNDRNQIFVSGYLGRDVFSADDVFSSNWGNATATFRWNKVFNEKLFSNLTFFYSNYDYELGFGDGEDSFDWQSRIINYSVKADFDYFLNPKNNIRFGGQIIFYKFVPGQAQGTSVGEVADVSLDNQYAWEASAYISNEQTITDKLSLEYGLRFSFFNYTGEGTAYEYGEPAAPGLRRPVIGSEEFDQWESIQTYNNFEPRFAIKYQLNDRSSIKASYNRMNQYIHLVSNTVAATPLDVWTPSTNNLKPQQADQYAIGYFRNFKKNAYEASVEAYYKDFDNLVDYINNADLLLNEFLEGDLLNAEGRAYGLEFFVKKNAGKLTGWIAYTLARSERKVAGINNDEWFPNRFDQTHNLNVVAFYDINQRWSLSANFVLISGTPATFPTNRIDIQGFVVPYDPLERRNNFRIPTYHRLDLSATLQGKKLKKNGKKRKNEDYWVFSVYNIYNKRNPFSVYFRTNESNPSQTEAVRLSVVGNFIPSISYNFKF